MQKFDFYKFLRIVFLILAIVSMIFAISSRVRAADAVDGVSSDPYDINSLSDALDLISGLSSSKKQIILDTFDSYCPYYTIYFDPYYNSLGVTGSDLPHQYIACPFIDSNPWRMGGLYYMADSSYSFSELTYCFKLYVHGDDCMLLKYVPGSSCSPYSLFNSEFSSSFGFTFNVYDDVVDEIILDEDYSIVSSMYSSSLYTYSFEDDFCLIQNNYSNVRPLGSTPSYFSFSHSFFLPSGSSFPDATDDIDIDKTYVDGALGIRVKWSVLPFPETGSFNYAGYTSITLDFDCDGTEVSVTLDSDDYPELFSNYDTSLPGNGSAYIPWSMVQKVKKLLQYAEYDVISCTGCSITMSGYPSGSPSSSASEYTMVAEKNPPLVLKGVTYVETPEFDTASVTPAADRPVSVEKGSTYQSNAFHVSNLYGLSSVEFNEFSYPSWCHVLSISVDITSSRGKYWYIRLWLNDNQQVYVYSDDRSVDEALSEFLSENSYSDFYDILIFDVISTDTNDNTHTIDSYYVYFTERYYTRLQFCAFEDLQTVLEADAYYMKHTALLLDSVLTNIDSNLVDFFTSSLDVDSKMLYYLDSINIKFDDLDRSVTSGTASIVAALNNLDSFDDTRIYNKLLELTGYIQALQSADSVNNPNTTILGQILNAVNSIEYPDPDIVPDWVSALLDFLGDLLDLLNSLSSDGIVVTLNDVNEPDTPQEYGFNLEIPDWSYDSDTGFSVEQASVSRSSPGDYSSVQDGITRTASRIFNKLQPSAYALLNLMNDNFNPSEDARFSSDELDHELNDFFYRFSSPESTFLPEEYTDSFFFFFTDRYDPYQYDGISQGD